MRTRIAPTPSGYLHVGNALNFLITQKLARSASGSILLRIDDLDTERARPEYITDVFDSLAWLGITWDEGPLDADDLSRNWSQLQRVVRYAGLASALRDGGHLYACICSRKQLATCTCRDRAMPLDAAETTWRLRVPSSCPVIINSWPSGKRTIELQDVMCDPVVRHRNGSPSYQLASLSDDIDYRIDLIVRGEDLLPSTVCQLYIADLLGLEAFAHVRFVHHPLITDASGAKLSKSQDADSLKVMRDEGLAPDALNTQADTLLARIVDQGL